LLSLAASLALPIAQEASGQSEPAGTEPRQLSIRAGAAALRYQYDPRSGSFGIARLTAGEMEWVPADTPSPALWIAGVQAQGQGPTTIDGNSGLELLDSVSSGASSASATLLHRESGLRLELEWAAEGPNAIVHRLELVNARSEGSIQVGWAATLAWRLYAGQFVEALAGDDAPEQWAIVRRGLPTSFGNHELRNAVDGVYPIVRFGDEGGSGIVVAVNSATAWRLEALPEDPARVIRAGEYQSDLLLRPGERASLPDVATIFYAGGAGGANAALHDYLEAISAPTPDGWSAVPPVVFNTWFGYGTDLLDTGDDRSPLRHAARVAANDGIEVFMIDAGWYLGNPIPQVAGDRGQAADKRPSSITVNGDDSDDGNDNSEPSQTIDAHAVSANDFDHGLGTWVENPEKWRARAGADGSRASGLRNFSDYIRKLEVRRQSGGSGGKMRFGLWAEPERYDPGYRGGDRVPSRWAMRGAPVLDFARQEVVEGITTRMQKMIDRYRVEYLKIDSNLDVVYDASRKRSGNYWTRWSLGYEQFLQNLRSANPDLYIELCASGLKRYWLGAMRYVNACWLDDDVRLGNVGWLLNATDAVMLPRQKTTLITEDLDELSDVASALRAYAGAGDGGPGNGGAVGFSSRIGGWSDQQSRAVAEAVEGWKLGPRGACPRRPKRSPRLAESTAWSACRRRSRPTPWPATAAPRRGCWRASRSCRPAGPSGS
jgi:hypothetical protein